MRKDAPGRAAGFSLLESMIVVAILAILAGLALPGFQDLLRRQRTAAAMHLLSTELALRTELTLRSRLALCAPAVLAGCAAECGSLSAGRIQTGGYSGGTSFGTGVVRIEGGTLTIPDFAGNLHFNTLGNLLVNPRAGLVFADFESGDVLLCLARDEGFEQLRREFCL